MRNISIAEARETMWNEFKKYPDFAETYKAQIACFIMDNFKGYKTNKEKRDILANELFIKLYKQKINGDKIGDILIVKSDDIPDDTHHLTNGKEYKVFINNVNEDGNYSMGTFKNDDGCESLIVIGKPSTHLYGKCWDIVK